MYTRFFKKKLPKDFSLNFMLVASSMIPAPLVAVLLFGLNKKMEEYIENKGQKLKQEDELLARGFKRVPIESSGSQRSFIGPVRPGVGFLAWVLYKNKPEYTWRNERGEEPTKEESNNNRHSK